MLTTRSATKRRVKRAAGGAAIACALLVTAACQRTTDRVVGTTTPTAAALEPERRILNSDAAMLITRARCQRLAACDLLGPTGRFGDADECVRGLFPQDTAVVAPAECPAGVGEAHLSECLSDLGDQACLEARAGASEPASCVRDLLCASPAEP